MNFVERKKRLVGDWKLLMHVGVLFRVFFLGCLKGIHVLGCIGRSEATCHRARLI